MKIKKILQYVAGIYLVLFLTVSYLLYTTVIRIDNAAKRSERASGVVKNISELRYLTFDYLLHQEERARVQWQIKYDSISKSLNELGPLSKNEEELFTAIQKNHHEIYTSYLSLISVLKKNLTNTTSASDTEIRDRYLDQLLIQSQEMVSKTFLLEQLSRNELTSAQQRVIAFVSLFFVLFAIGIGIVLIMINKRVIIPLNDIQTTIVNIIKGNFSLNVPIKYHDEIGELAADFNHMVYKLRRSEESYRKLIETSPDAIIVISPVGLIQIVDPQAAQMYGYENTNELLGKNIRNFISKDDQELVMNSLKNIFDKGKIENIQYTSFKKGGNPMRIEASASAIYSESGKPEAVIVVARDITKRELNEKKVRELASIVESSHDAILSKDLDGFITSWNRAAQVLYGYSEKEIIGKSIYLLIPEDRTEEELDILEKTKKGQKIEHYETKRKRKDGTIIDVSLTISPIRDEQGNIVGASKISRDISDRKRIEQMKSDFFCFF